ncbi:hypothetical protein Moror_624 [Moniliophthora roreri MCA 2997]|uniref:Uncharacterized protein n=1 Tax=Moniliophthora roreri (strain MCA 2997) TaxID=1381753 RepID=V2WT24_MONRO|nr:hypothetical protein Moror_624 [Moniliophthora roreri MCA 2997]
MNEVRESQKPLLGPLSTTPNASSEADIGSRRLGIRPLTQMQTETWVPTRQSACGSSEIRTKSANRFLIRKTQ